MSSNTSSASDIPKFLNPTREEFETIWHTLSVRERFRRNPPLEKDDSNRKSRSAEAFSTRVGNSSHNRRNNRYGDIVAYDATRVLIPLERKPPGETGDFHYVNASIIAEPDLGFPPELLPRRYWVAAQGPTRETVPSFLSLLLHPPCSPQLLLGSRPTTDTSPISLSPSSSSKIPPGLPLVKVIVQLTPLIEGSREKCSPYFPSSQNRHEELDVESGAAEDEGAQGTGWVWKGEQDRFDGGMQSIQVLRVGGDEQSRGVLARDDNLPGERRTLLRVGEWNEETDDSGREEGETAMRDIMHVEYKGWRDHGVPESPAELVSFIKRIQHLNDSHAFGGTSQLSNSEQISTGSPVPPILVHCSAGVGRTGTYITIASLLPLLSLLKSQPSLRSSLFDPRPPPPRTGSDYPAWDTMSGGTFDYVGMTVDKLRDQRTTMVQTREQLLFIFEALRTAWVQL